MSNASESFDEFESLIQEIELDMSLEDEGVNRSIGIVNNYQTLLFAMCPTGNSGDVVDAQRFCYTDNISVNDVTSHAPSESEHFDMSEFEHYDTMFFRWRSGQLLRVWSQLLGMGSESWLMFSMVCMTSTIQAMRDYYIAMDNEDNSLREIVVDNTMQDLFDTFLDMSPYNNDRSPEAQSIVDFIRFSCTEELKLDTVPDDYELKFNKQLKTEINNLIGIPIHAVAETMYELASITLEILMVTGKMFEFETPNEHKNNIENFCTHIRQRIVEDSFGD